jgi:hypothetical protein
VGHRLLALIALGAINAAACTTTPGKTGNGPFHPDASCPVTIENPAVASSPHVDVGTKVDYATNPPSSGPHYPIWATWGVHATPVPRSYYVHNMEHGGVILQYKCTDAASCASAEAFLKGVMDKLQTDKSCAPPVRVRVVITKDDAIPTPISASAWGWTYVSDCPDAPSLLDFVQTHYGQGPEDLCGEGTFGP